MRGYGVNDDEWCSEDVVNLLQSRLTNLMTQQDANQRLEGSAAQTLHQLNSNIAEIDQQIERAGLKV